MVPLIWVVLEYTRCELFTGFPWALFGYTQYENTALIQIADITGVYGVSFVLMLFNTAVFAGLTRIRHHKMHMAAALFVIILQD